MTKFTNKYDYDYKQTQYEVIKGPSLTVPDQTMTIKQIIDRYARGLSTGGQKVPLYEGEEDLLEGINWQTLDLAEKQAIKENFAQELNQIQLKINEQASKRKQKATKTETDTDNPVPGKTEPGHTPPTGNIDGNTV